MSLPAGEAATSVEAWLAEARRWAQVQLDRHLPPQDARTARLHEVVLYALMGGGKRLRPALVLLVGTELGASPADCERPAAAVEFIHAYSLAHDDLPCMDDDDLRRGRPSCHKVYGEALAVLAGDALQAAAFEALARGPSSKALEWIRILSDAAGIQGMVGGQALDLTLPARVSDAGEVREMHRRKTGALITAAVEMGAVAAGADLELRARARRYGAALGACFQAVDDILDVTGEARTLGKTPGKDRRLEKATLVGVLGLKGAREEAARSAEEARRAAREMGLETSSRGLRIVDWFLERQS